jgi:hypothetical protein
MNMGSTRVTIRRRKMKTPFKKYRKTGLCLLAVLLVASLTIATIPASTVQASSTGISTPLFDQPNTPPTGSQGPGTGLLGKALEREKKINRNLANTLDKTDNVVTRLEEAITTGQEKKRDVSALVDALKKFKEQISTARVAQNQAAGLLAHPAGFNQDGTVTDRDLAFKTIREIHQVQQDIRRQIGDSIKDALKAVREYHQDNPAN